MNNRHSDASHPDRLKGGAAAVPVYDPAVAPLAVKPKAACRMLSCGVTRLYELLAADELEGYRDGRSRLITVASIEGYIRRKIAEAKAPKDAAHSTAAAESL
jgi:excisionase family DNA binding protein